LTDVFETIIFSTTHVSGSFDGLTFTPTPTCSCNTAVKPLLLLAYRSDNCHSYVARPCPSCLSSSVTKRNRSQKPHPAF